MKIIPFLLSLCFSITVFGQNYDFGKVSEEELQETRNPLDSSASAAYLYKYENNFFEYSHGTGFQLITEVHQRIKIYNQEGYKYATNKIMLYNNGKVNQILSDIQATTYNLIDGGIKKTKLEKEGIFKTELNKNVDAINFTLPDINQGSVIEFTYKIISPFFTSISYVFQHDIPIKKIEARFETPEYLNFKVNATGFLPIKITNEVKNDKITFTNSSRAPSNISTSNSRFSTSDLNYRKFITLFTMSDVPALKEEPYVNNINNYRSVIEYELSYTSFQQSPIQYYSTTWENVVKTIYEHANFGDELNKSSYYEDEIDNLLNNVADPVTKMSLTFDFVKSKVKWNGSYNKYCIDGVRNAYKNHIGNIAEINLMLISMLRYVGLNANPVLVSTRENGVPLFPTVNGYNYVICSIEFPNETILLDASDNYSVPNILPRRTLNWEGRIINKDGSSRTINLYPSEKSKDVISAMINLKENGDLSGSIRTLKTNHDALVYRNTYNGVNQDKFLDHLESKYGELEISDFKVTNKLDFDKPIIESYNFKKLSQADVIGSKMYISPLFFFRINNNPFKLETRAFPIDFGYPSENSYRIIINIPTGYKVESFPDAFAIALPDDLGLFKYNILVNDGKIQLAVDQEINTSVIPSQYYEALKDYFSKIIEKEAEKIVLIKA